MLASAFAWYPLAGFSEGATRRSVVNPGREVGRDEFRDALVVATQIVVAEQVAPLTAGSAVEELFGAGPERSVGVRGDPFRVAAHLFEGRRVDERRPTILRYRDAEPGCEPRICPSRSVLSSS